MKFINKGIPFRRNSLLKPIEINALSHYRDAGTNQINWDYFVPANRWKDRDCFMINGVLKGNILKNYLMNSDKKLLLDLIPLISSATRKNRVSDTFTVYKGLSSDSWITEKFDKNGKPLENAPYMDYAFGSFTSNPKIAVKYSQKFNKKDIYLLVQTLEIGDCALYIDDKEYEWLLPENIYYSFEKKNIIPLENGGKQITYYIKRVNR